MDSETVKILVEIVSILLSVAAAVASATAMTKDDEFVAWVQKWWRRARRVILIKNFFNFRRRNASTRGKADEW